MAGSSTPSRTTAAPSRLPSTRERRPALAALAVLLILGGSLASAWLAVRAGNREEFVQIRTEVDQGVEISRDDLTTVELPEDYQDAVPASQLDEVVGRYSAVAFVPGQVLVGTMVSDEDGIPTDTEVVSTEVSPQEASTYQIGSGVIINGSTSGDESSLARVAGTVLSVGDPSSTSATGTSDVLVRVSVTTTCAEEATEVVLNNDYQLTQYTKLSADASAGVCGAREP